MQFNLRNKVVWVTGASSGIGLALAEDLYNEGAKLVISARNESQLIELKNKFPIKHSSLNIHHFIVYLCDKLIL